MFVKKLTKQQKVTRRRILEISFERKLSHIGSCLSTVDLIDAIYSVKDKDERFILSNGHAGVALYVVLEKYQIIKSGEIEALHVHPDRNPRLGIDVSTGSLGQGLPIALGMALASRKNNVYCIISDGECAEGSVWESLRIAVENKVSNLKIILNANGWGAYGLINPIVLKARLEGFGFNSIDIDGHNIKLISRALKSLGNNGMSILFAKTNVEQFSFLKGQDAHYYIMNGQDFKKAMDELA